MTQTARLLEGMESYISRSNRKLFIFMEGYIFIRDYVINLNPWTYLIVIRDYVSNPKTVDLLDSDALIFKVDLQSTIEVLSLTYSVWDTHFSACNFSRVESVVS